MRRDDYEVVGRARKWGLNVMRAWACAERQAIEAAPSAAPTVNLTVIHVEAGAVLSVGGVILGPSLTPAVPQRRAVIAGETEGTGEPE